MPHFWFIIWKVCLIVTESVGLKLEVCCFGLGLEVQIFLHGILILQFVKKKCENNIVGCDKMSLTRSPLDKSTGNHRLAADTDTFLPVYFFAEVIVI